MFFATPPVDGVFQEYVAHEAGLCFPLPENVSTLEGALIEPLAVGFHAANQAEAGPGQRAVVLGSGCIGLVSMMALRARGVPKVFVTDVMDKRLQKAEELGAAATVNSAEEDAVQAVMRLTEGPRRGCDHRDVRRAAGRPPGGGDGEEGRRDRVRRLQQNGEVTLPMSMALDKELTFRTVFRYRNIYPMAIRGRGQRRRQPQGHRHEFLRV